MTAEPSGINDPNFLAELKDAIRNRRCILLTGSGFLAQIQSRDLPATWRDCLYNIVDWCAGSKQLIREQEELEAILTLIDEGQLSDASKKLEDNYLSDKELLAECLNEVLLHESILQQPAISELHDLVVQIRFRAYFTTNYDTFLEQAFLSKQKNSLNRHDERSIADAVSDYGRYLPFILKLHGDLKRSGSLLLGDRDFKRLREGAHGTYRNGLKQFLMASSVLCIGFEETDHDLACLLAEAGIESKPHIDRRNKYWSLVVETGQTGGGEDSRDKRIKIIPCRKEELVVFFNRLLASLQPHSGQEVSNRPNGGGSGTNGEHQHQPQPEQAVFSQDGSSPNATNADGKFVHIYVSYDEKDQDSWKQLDSQLESMKEWVAVKSRAAVAPGKDEKDGIRQIILYTNIMLLMVSPDFTNSEMCQYEVEEAMKRHQELRIIPIILRPVDWTQEPYGKLRSLPGNGKSVSEAQNKDAVLYNIAMAIKGVVDELRQPQQSQ